MSDPPRGAARPSREPRILAAGVSWAFYERFVDGLPATSAVRAAFDGEDMEILVKGPLHEDFRSLLGRFVEEVAGEIGVAFLGLGETTWKRPDVGRGLEADRCFYFDPAKVAAARAAPGPPPAPAERPAVRLSGRWSVHRVANLGGMGKNRALARGSSGEAPGERHHGDSRATRPV